MTLLVLALALPTACGVAVWSLLLGRPRSIAALCAAVGAGYLGGSVALGALLRRFDGLPIENLFASLSPWLAGFALLVGGLAVWRAPLPAASMAPARASARERIAVAAIWLLLAICFVLILQQATALPTLAWDAWNAWMAKSRAWVHLGRFVDVLDMAAWSEAVPGSAITTVAPGYPQALSRFAVWLASAAGGWQESAVHAAWPLAWLAMGLACFGYLGLAGVRTLPASLVALALLTMPLMTAHAALAGYADLWQAAIVMLAAVHVARAFALRSYRDACVAVLFAALAITVKLEGAVWMLCLALAAVFTGLSTRWRCAMLALPVLLVAALWLVGGFSVPIPGLGLVRFEWGAIELPAIGRMTLAWRPVLDEFALSLWLLPNWSMLWYLAPLVVALRWRRIARDPASTVLATFIALGAAFLFVLFFFTDAAVWAENYTSINRVLMQLVPALVVWLSLLWLAPALRDRAPSTDA